MNLHLQQLKTRPTLMMEEDSGSSKIDKLPSSTVHSELCTPSSFLSSLPSSSVVHQDIPPFKSSSFNLLDDNEINTKKRKRMDDGIDEESSSPSSYTSSLLFQHSDTIFHPQNILVQLDSNHNEEPEEDFFIQSTTTEDNHATDLFSGSFMQSSPSIFDASMLHSTGPIFESEEALMAAFYDSEDSKNNHTKRNKLSPHSHLTEFVRDNILQYLLFHLKIDSTKNVEHAMLDEGMDDLEVDIPIGLLLDYIVQQAQKLYFDMYEYVRELASCPVHHNLATASKREAETNLSCNEFELMVIEQVHILIDQIRILREGGSVISVVKKYENILPRNLKSLNLISGGHASIGSGASFTSVIVDDSSLFNGDYQPSNSFNFNYNRDNEIRSLLSRSKFNFSALSKLIS